MLEENLAVLLSHKSLSVCRALAVNAALGPLATTYGTGEGAELARSDPQHNLPPNTGELTLPNPSQTGWYLIYLPQRDGRLS